MGVDHICQKGLRHEDVLNNWTSHWVLRGGDGTGRQRVETHEDVVMRYAEIRGAPEAPTAEYVRGWAVQYPFDGLTAESGDGAPIDAECTARRSEGELAAAALTEFQSSSPTLNAVWRLCRYTVLVGALDSNTDSNTRQRDVCNLDAMLASRYQGAVAAQAAEHPRRQVAATLSTPQADTNNHTLEFNMAAVAAVFFHALELGDMSVVENRFDELLRRFGLLDLMDAEGTGLVCGAADALVDHPPSPFIDVDETVRARERLNGFSCKSRKQGSYPIVGRRMLGGCDGGGRTVRCHERARGAGTATAGGTGGAARTDVAGEGAQCLSGGHCREPAAGADAHRLSGGAVLPRRPCLLRRCPGYDDKRHVTTRDHVPDGDGTSIRSAAAGAAVPDGAGAAPRARDARPRMLRLGGADSC